MGQMHNSLAGFDQVRPNPLGADTWRPFLERCGRDIDTIEPGLFDRTEAALTAVLPMPPRRPVEVASAGPKTPTSRVDAAAAGRDDRAAPPGPVRSAASSSSPLGRPGLPAAITQGIAPGPVPGRVLAFAPSTPLPAVPLPVTRPAFVAARLDRTNFHSLTGATRTDHLASRVGLGSGVAALRPAAQASAAALSSDGVPGARRGFGTRATDLSTDRFSGAAVSPEERINTATLRKRSAAPSAND